VIDHRIYIYENRILHVITAFFVILSVNQARNLLFNYPIVLPDELIYSFLSKFLKDRQLLEENFFVSVMQNLLFFQIYNLLYELQSNQLLTARILNSLFYSMLVFPLYGINRYFFSHRTSLSITVFCALMPICTYTTYFMPESLYFLSFYVLLYFILRTVSSTDVVKAISISFIISTMSFIKPHATVFVLPTMICSVLMSGEKHSGYGGIVKYSAIFLASFLASRVVLAGLLGYEGGFFSAGPIYDFLIGKSFSYLGAGNLYNILLNLSGHMIYLLALWLIPLFIITMASIEGILKQPDTRLRLLCFLLVTYLIVLIASTSVFSAAVAGLGPYEAPNRLHGRYYNFVFPAILIGFLAAMKAIDFSDRAVKRAIKYGLVPSGMILIAILPISLKRYSYGIVDYPEVFWLQLNEHHSVVLILLLYAASFGLFLLLRSKRHWPYVVYLLLVFSMAVWSVTREQLRASGPTIDDKIGALVENSIATDDLDNGLILEHSAGARIFRILHQIGFPVKYEAMPTSTVITREMIPEDTSWVLLLGGYQMNDLGSTLLTGDGFRIIELGSPK